MGKFEKLTHVTLPAIMPQIITALRVTAGVCWLVVVAAEMIAGRDGLGFAVMDSRNGLRTDILVVEMIIIGMVGVGIDRVLEQLTRISRFVGVTRDSDDHSSFAASPGFTFLRSPQCA